MSVNVERARDFIDRASVALKQSKECLSLREYAVSVLRAQECIELSLKAAVLLIGAEYSSDHDVSGDLVKNRDKFPEWFKKKTPIFAFRSKIANILRKYASYGYERMGATAKELFNEYLTKTLAKHAEEIYNDCNRFFYEVKMK